MIFAWLSLECHLLRPWHIVMQDLDSYLQDVMFDLEHTLYHQEDYSFPYTCQIYLLIYQTFELVILLCQDSKCSLLILIHHQLCLLQQTYHRTCHTGCELDQEPCLHGLL